MLPDKNGVNKPWMIWWLENMKASGYNRYVVLKMTHSLTLEAAAGQITQWAYFYGPGTAKILDAIKSPTGSALYKENNNLHMFITTANGGIKKETYFEVTTMDIPQGYRITGLDVTSTPGVEYITVDPVYRYDLTPAPAPTTADDPDDFYWLTGGGN